MHKGIKTVSLILVDCFKCYWLLIPETLLTIFFTTKAEIDELTERKCQEQKRLVELAQNTKTVRKMTFVL